MTTRLVVRSMHVKRRTTTMWAAVGARVTLLLALALVVAPARARLACPLNQCNAPTTALLPLSVCRQYEALACCRASPALDDFERFVGVATAGFSNAACRAALEAMWCGLQCSAAQGAYTAVFDVAPLVGSFLSFSLSSRIRVMGVACWLVRRRHVRVCVGACAPCARRQRTWRCVTR